jgi:hypothetical protein
VIDPKRLPTPEQMRAWLEAHGWTPESPLHDDPEYGVMYTYKEKSDFGEELTVLAPRTIAATPRYGLRVRDIVVSAAFLAQRPEAEVYEEMLAIRPRATVA